MTSAHLARKRFKVLFAGICSMLLTVGIARFSYTPMLPIMQNQAGLGVAEGGWLAAINYVGYLIGALIAAKVTSLQVKDRLYRIGLVVAIITTVMMGMSNDFWLLALSRFLAGICAVGGMLLGAALILNWLLRHDMRSELGMHFSGLGLGIAMVALFVEMASRYIDWSQQWYGMAILGTLLMVPAWRWLPPPSSSSVSQQGRVLNDRPPQKGFLAVFMLSYLCAGIGYVVSATFIVALIDQMPGLEGKGTWAFLLLGVCAAPATMLWDLFARRWGPYNAMVLAFVVQGVAALLPVLSPSLPMVLLSAALFGGTFTGIVSLVLTLAGLYYPTKPAKMMGSMTMCYGVGQIFAPAITGILAEQSGNYNAGMYMAAVGLFVGALLTFYLRSQPDAQKIAQ
jgi:predicted MFS family arabinose efflux permease